MFKNNHILIIHLLISIVIFLCGCNQNSDLKKAIKEMTESTICIPEDMELYHDGCSIPLRTNLLKSHIFIVFLSPDECIGCAISNLHGYEDLRDTCIKNNISFMPIISPSKDDIELAKYYIDESECSFPVFIDSNETFYSTNSQIPIDKRFHYFLLGPDRKPIFVGDPRKNEKLNRLFNATISSL